MPSESAPQTPRRPWTLLLGPGTSLTRCLPVLEALAQDQAEAPAAIEQIADWSDLFACMDEVGSMLIDADQFGLEHLGLLKAFLKRFPSWDLALMGRDAATRPLKELLRLDQVRWVPAPMDIDTMVWLLQPPTQLYGDRSRRASARPLAAHPVTTLPDTPTSPPAPPAFTRGSVPVDSPPGNIPPGYVTRSTDDNAMWEEASPPALPSEPAPSSDADTGALATYEIPRAEPDPTETDEGRPAEFAPSGRGELSSRLQAGEADADPELNEETEAQLLAEVERILVGNSESQGATMTALAPARSAAPAMESPKPSAPQFDTAPLTEAAETLQPDLESVAAELAPLQELSPAEPQVVSEEQLDADADLDPSKLSELAAVSELAEGSEIGGEFVQEPAQPPLMPAPFFKHQVADLADIVQCVDMGLDQAAEDLLDPDSQVGVRLAARFEQLCGEVARLRQYTRTLSFMASPPGAGEQTFDLAPMLEEMLTMRRSEVDAPRYLIRTPDGLPLRSDKLLLTQALDALLFLCHASAGPGGTVRVDGRLVDDEDMPIQVSIRFPAGQLADLEPNEIVQPYALRRTLPELGPNSLAAATGILRGQGGDVELVKEPRGGLEWLIRLPRAGA